MTVTEKELDIDGGGGTLYVTVSSNRKVSVSSGQEWCEAQILSETDSDNLMVTVGESPGQERTTSIVLTAPDCRDEVILVRQHENKDALCDLLSFKLDREDNNLNSNIVFTVDKSALTATAFHLNWIDGDDPATLIPAFTINGEKVLVNGGALESGVTKLSFANDITLVVEARNGNTKTYTVSLVCPQINTELPVLRLRPESEINSKEVYVKTTVDLYSPATASGWWDAGGGQVEVRGRGNSTWILPKKPYRLKFPEKFSPVGLDHAKEKSWVILAHDMDKSLLRNHLAFEFSRILFDASEGYHDPGAIMFTPCSQFVNVYMGDSYHGLYQMSDHMQRADGRIAVDKLTASDGADPAKITGGHILETDIHSESAPVRFRSGKGVQINHKYPEDDDCDQAQYDYMEEFIEKVETALYGVNFKDPVEGWRKYMDEKTLIDFIIIKELAGDFDGYTSTYMYKRRGIDKVFFGPVWDVDKGWDNEKRNDHLDPGNNLMINAGFRMPGIGSGDDWFQRLWQDEELRKSTGERWTSRKNELVGAVLSILDEKPGRMAKSIKANFRVWTFYYQASTEAKMPAATYELEIERIRTLTLSRADLLDRLFK